MIKHRHHDGMLHWICLYLLFLSINQSINLIKADFSPGFRVLTGPTSNVLLDGLLQHYQMFNQHVKVERSLATNGSFFSTSSPSDDAFDADVAKQALFNRQIDLAMLGTPFSALEQALHPTIAQFPYAAVPIVPVYSLIDETTHQPINQLILSGHTLTQIFGGFVTMWNDTLLQKDNPEINLPARSIMLVLSSIDSIINVKFISSIIQLDQSIHNSSNVTEHEFDVLPSRSPSWPLHRYAKYMYSAQVAAAVVAHPYSISYCTWHSAVSVGANTAMLLNFRYANQSDFNHSDATLSGITTALIDEGPVVVVPQISDAISVSTNSLQQAFNTAATIQIQTTEPTLNAITLDLNAADLSYSWLIIHVEYVAIDLATSRTTCFDRAEVVKFILWLYSSSTATRAMFDLQAAPMPTVVLTQLDLISRISAIQCKGTRAVPITKLNGLTVTGEERTSKFNSQLLLQHNLNLDASVRSTNEFLWEENESDTAFYRVVYSEASMAMVFEKGSTTDYSSQLSLIPIIWCFHYFYLE